jgi:short-chain fatty acids transporter
MEQPNKLKSAPEEEQGALAHMGAALADWSERWFPDAYVFAVLAVAIVVLGALAMGKTPMKIATDFGNGFWTLIPFTMQMAFVVIGGYIVAVAKPVQKFIIMLAAVPKTPKVAVAYVAFMAMLASLLSWGFSLIFGGFLMREVARRVPNVDFRAISAAGYLGLGSVWALGLSSSAALLMVTKASIPPAMLDSSTAVL